MKTTELIGTLAALGIKVSAQGQELKVAAPKGALTTELRESLIANKSELLRLLNSSSAETSILPMDRGVPLAVSTTQERFLILNKLYPGSVAYNLPNLHQLDGELDLDAFERAVAAVVQRHEVLRTTFAEVGGLNRQIISPNPNHDFTIVDLESQANPAERARVLSSKNANTPFNLYHGPLLRVTLYRCSDTLHLFNWTLHHSVSDGWSSMIFLRDLKALYESTPLPAPELQYADFGSWERKQIASGAFAPQLDYWKQRLSGAVPLLSLPTDFTRPAVKTYQGRCIDFSIDLAMAERCKKIAQKHGVTLFTLLLSAFKVLLHRYSGQDDICVGTPIARRNHDEIESVYGCFINTLALMSDLSDNPTVEQVLASVRATSVEAFANQDIPFEQVVEAVNPQRDTSSTPLFQTMFIFHVQDGRKVDQLGGVSVSPLEIHADGAKYDITLELTDTQDGLRGFIEYSTDLFDSASIERMTGHFQALLQGMLKNQHATISSLPLLVDGERDQLIDGRIAAGNKPSNEVQEHFRTGLYPEKARASAAANEKLLFVEKFAEIAGRFPDKVAVIANGRTLSYRELNTLSNSVAHMLIDKGVGAQSLVGICINRSLQMLVGLLGVLKTGAAYVPLDPDYPNDRLHYMLETAEIGILLTQTDLLDVCAGYECQRICIDKHLAVSASVVPSDPIVRSNASDLAYVIFTSGSTGKPKGVQVTQGSLINFLASMAREPGFTHADTLLSVTTLSFDISVLELYLPLSVGGTTVIADRDAVSDGKALKHLIKEHNVNVLQATPSTWQLLLLSGWSGSPSFKALSGGEAIMPELVADLLPKVGELWNMYGPTETTVWSTCYHLRSAHEPVLIGKPIANTQCYVLDAQQQLLPIGIPGELYIGGLGVSSGYLNRSDLTTERFVDDPFGKLPGAKLYRTGDLVRWRQAGQLEYLQRMDDQVKIRGFRIELGEVENTIAGLPGVRQAAARLFTDAQGNDKRIVGYIASNEPLNVSELRQALQQRLPAFMVPSSFVSLESLPLTDNGKVNKLALPEPDSERPVLANDFKEASSALEKTIAGIWSELLNLDSVGVNDNFFDLGGHSLLLVQIHARLQSHFNRTIPLLDLFRYTTVRSQAILVQGDDEKVSLTKSRDRAGKQQQMLKRYRRSKRASSA